MAAWDFCEKYLVVENLPPEQVAGMSMNGWSFSSKPTIPYQHRFKVTIHGMKWHLQTNGLYDTTTDPAHNARRFEQFVAAHGLWNEFDFPHPHLGPVKAKFKALPSVPKGEVNSGGLIPAFEVELIHNNPGY